MNKDLINRFKLGELMKSYLDDNNFNYTLFNELLEKLNFADKIADLFGWVWNQHTKENKDE